MYFEKHVNRDKQLSICQHLTNIEQALNKNSGTPINYKSMTYSTLLFFTPSHLYLAHANRGLCIQAAFGKQKGLHNAKWLLLLNYSHKNRSWTQSMQTTNSQSCFPFNLQADCHMCSGDYHKCAIVKCYPHQILNQTTNCQVALQTNQNLVEMQTTK